MAWWEHEDFFISREFSQPEEGGEVPSFKQGAGQPSQDHTEVTATAISYSILPSGTPFLVATERVCVCTLLCCPSSPWSTELLQASWPGPSEPTPFPEALPCLTVLLGFTQPVFSVPLYRIHTEARPCSWGH